MIFFNEPTEHNQDVWLLDYKTAVGLLDRVIDFSSDALVLLLHPDQGVKLLAHTYVTKY